MLYVYKTVRDPKAPGERGSCPSSCTTTGVGSSFDVVELNKDGKLDIVVGTIFGTFTFTSKAAPPTATPRK